MDSKAIKRRYYVFSGANTLAASVIWGVNTLFLLDSGLNLFQVFLVNTIFTASMTLFEIPTGAVADSWGRKVSLAWSAFMLFLGTLGYLASGVFGWGMYGFSLFSVVLGLGFTFFSGAAEAWVVDELKFLGEEGSSAGLFARAASASSAMMLVGTVLGGFAGSLDYSIPYIARAILFLFMLFFTIFAMPEKGWKPDARKIGFAKRIRETAVDSVRFGLKIRSLRYLMGISFFLGSFMMWGFYAMQPYITDMAGFPGAAWFSGIVTAILSLSQIAGQIISARVDATNGRRKKVSGAEKNKVVGPVSFAMFLTAMGVTIVGLAGLQWLGGMTVLRVGMAIGGMIVMMGCLGYAGPVLRNALHERIPSEKRATIISLDSMVGSGGAIIGQPALGRLADVFGIPMGYFGGTIIMLFTLPCLRRFGKCEVDEKNRT